jgi:hypothetical protein
LARDGGKTLDLKGFAQSFGEAFDAGGFVRAFWAAIDLGNADRSFAAGFRDGVAFIRTQICRASAALRQQDRMLSGQVQNNVGDAPKSVGERESESGTDRPERAFAASSHNVLRERTSVRVSRDLKRINPRPQRKTGNKVTKKLERTGNGVKITRDRKSSDGLFGTQMLGTEWRLSDVTFRRPGKREGGGGTEPLEEEVLAYREALKERTRERVPLDWAITQNNLGTVLQRLGDRESSTDRLKEAITAYDAALEVFIAAKADYYIKLTQRNRANATALLEQHRKEPT